jgi:hypothetical protein
VKVRVLALVLVPVAGLVLALVLVRELAQVLEEAEE